MVLWYKHLLEFEAKHHWEPPMWTVRRQLPDYAENFSFVLRNVLYVAIHVVGGEIKDQSEWNARSAANLLWVDAQLLLQSSSDGASALVLFMHSDPANEMNANFVNDLFVKLQSYKDMPILLVHRNNGVDSSQMENNYAGIPNLSVLTVEGGTWPPMRVEMSSGGSFDWNQTYWFDKAVGVNQGP